MGNGNESAGNPSPAPPHRSKGPGVSAGRSHRLTGACPTVVINHLRKVDAARSFASQTTKIEAKVVDFRGSSKNCRPPSQRAGLSPNG